jgi:hypothetical protein
MKFEVGDVVLATAKRANFGYTFEDVLASSPLGVVKVELIDGTSVGCVPLGKAGLKPVFFAFEEDELVLIERRNNHKTTKRI